MMHLTMLFVLSQCLMFGDCTSIEDKLFNNKIIQVIRIDGQCRGKDVAFQTFFSRIKCNSRTAFLANHTVLVKQSLMDNIKMSVTINRCRSRENLDSCDEFHKMQNIDFCKSLNPADKIIASPTTITIPYNPQLKCPIEKGIYHAFNFTFNLTPFLFFNLDDWYWRIKIEMFPGKTNRLLGCVHIEACTNSKPQV